MSPQPVNGPRACPVCWKRGRACKCGTPEQERGVRRSALEELADKVAEQMKTKRVLNVQVGKLAELAQAMRARGFKAEVTEGISLTTGEASQVVRVTKKRAKR